MHKRATISSNQLHKRVQNTDMVTSTRKKTTLAIISAIGGRATWKGARRDVGMRRDPNGYWKETG